MKLLFKNPSVSPVAPAEGRRVLLGRRLGLAPVPEGRLIPMLCGAIGGLAGAEGVRPSGDDEALAAECERRRCVAHIGRPGMVLGFERREVRSVGWGAREGKPEGTGHDDQGGNEQGAHVGTVPRATCQGFASRTSVRSLDQCPPLGSKKEKARRVRKLPSRIARGPFRGLRIGTAGVMHACGRICACGRQASTVFRRLVAVGPLPGFHRVGAGRGNFLSV